MPGRGRNGLIFYNSIIQIGRSAVNKVSYFFRVFRLSELWKRSIQIWTILVPDILARVFDDL